MAKHLKNNLKMNSIVKISIILILFICLFIIYRFNFMTKSEAILSVKVSFNENNSDNIYSMDVECAEEDGNYYIILPEKINGIYVNNYYVNAESLSPVKNNEGENNSDNKKIVENTSFLGGIIKKTTSIEKAQKVILTTESEALSEIVNEEDNNLNIVEENDSSAENIDENNISDVDDSNIIEHEVDNSPIIDEDAEQKNIDSSIQNEIDTSIENNENEEIKVKDSNIKTIKPGEKFYISKDAIDNDDILISVDFQTVEFNNTKLYNQELISEQDHALITVTCFTPLGFKLDVNPLDVLKFQELKADVEELNNQETLLLYDIKIKNEDEEFQPIEYNQVATIEFKAPSVFRDRDLKHVEVYHVDESSETINFEKLEIESTEGYFIEVKNNEFSTYALLYSGITSGTNGDAFTINDYNVDYNYYMGKNYIDNNNVYNAIYTKDNLAEVKVTYHGNRENPTINSGDEQVIVKTGGTSNISKNLDFVSATRTSRNGNSAVVNIILRINDLPDYRTFDSDFTLTDIDILLNANVSLADSANYSRNGNRITSMSVSRSNFDSTNNTITFDVNITRSVNSADLNVTGTNNGQASLRILNHEVRVLKYKIAYTDGFISPTERQNKVIYVKCVPVNGTANVELIDNPFSDRSIIKKTYYEPTDLTMSTPLNTTNMILDTDPNDYTRLCGFDGWTTSSGICSFENDDQTKSQILKINCNGKDSVSVDVYANWQEANTIFVGRTSSGDATGKDINNVKNVANLGDAISAFSSNQKTALVASNRELNIIVHTGGTIGSSGFPSDIAYTVTSVYDGKNHSDAANGNAIINSIQSTTKSKDMQLEYLKFDNNQDYQSENSTSTFLNANGYNVRVGRGMLTVNAGKATFNCVQGGCRRGYRTRVVIESGIYSSMSVINYHISNQNSDTAIGTSNNAATRTSHMDFILGNDIDRINDDNNLLNIYFRLSGRTARGIAYKMNGYSDVYKAVIKSGSFGTEYFNTTGSNTYTCGIYCGGLTQTTDGNTHDEGDRILEVEGGRIANIIGGLFINSGTSYKTYIKVKNGNIMNIVGGAGTNETFGDRYIQITGGFVRNSVFGGSNGFKGSEGQLSGQTYIYVGGNAKIGAYFKEISVGNTSYVITKNDNTLGTFTEGSTNNSTNFKNLYGAEPGCVFGSANGQSSTNANVYASNIIIDGDIGTGISQTDIENYDSIKSKCIIYGSVYGGGNHGLIKPSSGNYNASTNDPTVGSTSDPDLIELLPQTAIDTTSEYLITTATTGGNALTGNGNSLSNQTVNTRTIPTDSAKWILEASSDPGKYYIKNVDSGAYLYLNIGINTYYSYDAVNIQGSGSSTTFTQYKNGEYFLDNQGNTSITTDIVINRSGRFFYSYTMTVNGSTTSSQYSNTFTIYHKVLHNDEILTTELSLTNKTAFNINFTGTNAKIYSAQNSKQYHLKYSGGNWNISDGQANVCILKFNELDVPDTDIIDIITETRFPVVSKINVVGGYIDENVFGGCNKNTVYGSSEIDVDNGIINAAVYGGSNDKGDITGTSNINLNGGTINGVSTDTGVNGDAVFGGGKGKDTNIDRGVLLALKNSDTKLEINGNVYGGSALGKIYGNTYIDVNDLSPSRDKIDVKASIFGGGKGNASSTGNNIAKSSGYVLIKVDGANLQNAKIFGHYNLKGIVTNIINIKIGETYSSYVKEVYGGGNEAEIDSAQTKKIRIDILENGSVDDVYGGSNQASATTNNAHRIVVDGGRVMNAAYGGSNSSGTIYAPIIQVKNGATVNKIFGGGKGENTSIGTDSTSSFPTITVEDSIVNNIAVAGEKNGSIFGGSENGKVYGSPKITVNNSFVKNVYGAGFGATSLVIGTPDITIENKSRITSELYGGGSAGDVNGNTDIKIKGGSTVANLYGAGEGSSSEVTENTDITITTEDASNVTTIGTAFGGGNAGKVLQNTVINCNDSKINIAMYGAGLGSDATVSGNSTVNFKNSNSPKVYGGGKNGSIEGNTTLKISDLSSVNTVFGAGEGSNSNVGGNTNIEVTTPTGSSNMTNIETVYGGGDAGTVTGNTNIKYSGSNCTLGIYGGGYGTTAKVNGSPKIEILNSHANDVYGGGNAGEVGNGSETVTIDIDSSLILGNLYGGGNLADVKGTLELTVDNSNFQNNIFGGGNQANITNVNMDVTNSTINGNIFGGGNLGNVTQNVHSKVTVCDINNSIYGGGNGEDSNVTPLPQKGGVLGNISLEVYKNTVEESVFGGGNGKTSRVNGNITVNVVGENHITKSVFGGGNASNTGVTGYPSIVKLNVSGGIIGENVYGGANLAQVIGNTYVCIGQDAIYDVSNIRLMKDSIDIAGTVYSGGEMLATSGSSGFDSSAISVTGDMYIYIDANDYENNNYDFNIGGSIFGSAHTANSVSNGYIFIRNFGKEDDIKEIVSIQRAKLMSLKNSHIRLEGDLDSMADEEFATKNFTLVLINELILSNNSVLYLKTDVTKVASWKSAVDETGNILETVTVALDNKSVTKNVDNRVYLYDGVNLNIAKDQQVTMYGDVKGMAFLGIYTETESLDVDNNVIIEYNKGMYDQDYERNHVGDRLVWSERNYQRSYVLGIHVTDYNVDGFYTVYENLDPAIANRVDLSQAEYEDPSVNNTSYIDIIVPTPDNDIYYIWAAGPAQNIYYYNFDLIASKYSTQGTYELNLIGLSFPDARIDITSLDASGLSTGVTLVDESIIPSIDSNLDRANKQLGLTMQTGNLGWSMIGSTDYYYNDPDGTGMQEYFEGTDIYKFESSSATPSLRFFLHHANNINQDLNLGRLIIRMQIVYWVDALTPAVAGIQITVNLSSKVITSVGYNGAITPGTQYGLFNSNRAEITDKSSFSAYFELAEDNFMDYEAIQNHYNDSYRVITTDEFVFPEKTTITMIDYSIDGNPTYYYYDVTAADYASGKKRFKLQDFLVMGTTNQYYDEDVIQQSYNRPIVISGDTHNYEYECFVFIVDFRNADFSILTKDADNCYTTRLDGSSTFDGQVFTLSMDYDDPVDPTQHSSIAELNDTQLIENIYNMYDEEATIGINASLSKSKIYAGTSTNLKIVSLFNTIYKNGKAIFDTRYFNQKMGVKITFYRENPDGTTSPVSGSDILGTYFKVGSNIYYPRADGTIRIKIADLVSNITTNAELNTDNSIITTGKYQMFIESYGCADGQYYGIKTSSSATVPIEIVNGDYGLHSKLPEMQGIIDKVTGRSLTDEGRKSDLGSNELNFYIDYQSGLTTPYLTVSLYRRKYNLSDVYGTEYELVDLKDFVDVDYEKPLNVVDQDFTPTAEEIDYMNSTFNQFIGNDKFEYTLYTTEDLAALVTEPENPTRLEFDMTLKQNLRSGTYKFVFRLYDAYMDTTRREITSGGITSYKDFKHLTYEEIGDSITYILIK